MDPTPSIPGREWQAILSRELRDADAGTAAGSYAEYLRKEHAGPPSTPVDTRATTGEQ